MRSRTQKLVLGTLLVSVFSTSQTISGASAQEVIPTLEELAFQKLVEQSQAVPVLDEELSDEFEFPVVVTPDSESLVPSPLDLLAARTCSVKLRVRFTNDESRNFGTAYYERSAATATTTCGTLVQRMTAGASINDAGVPFVSSPQQVSGSESAEDGRPVDVAVEQTVPLYLPPRDYHGVGSFVAWRGSVRVIPAAGLRLRSGGYLCIRAEKVRPLGMRYESCNDEGLAPAAAALP